MNREELRARLTELRDESYRDFMERTLKTVPKEKILGVRTSELRKLAKALAKSEYAADFLKDVPHEYFEENQIHMFALAETRDYAACVAEVDAFLPYVDNWATCDQCVPKCFAKHKEELLGEIRKWIASDHAYTIRYGIGLLMGLYLDADFRPEYPEWVAAIRSEEYYVNMMRAWYFATALAKQWNAAIAYLETPRLDQWTHNKTIQKAIESYRITDEQKVYLRTLKMK